MPLLSLFSKKDKPSKQAPVPKKARSRPSTDESEYVLPEINIPGLANGPSTYEEWVLPPSSNKLKLAHPLPREQEDPASSSSVRIVPRSPVQEEQWAPNNNSTFPSLQPPPPRLFHDSEDARSTKSLPEHRPMRPTPRPLAPHPANRPTSSFELISGQKRTLLDDIPPSTSVKDLNPPKLKEKKSMFAWARDRKKSTTAKDKPPLTPLSPSSPSTDSFNLKAFRHVRPVSPGGLPSVTETTPPSSYQLPAARSRVSSLSSEGSGKITVAQFKQAQARRSSSHLPDPVEIRSSTPPRPPRNQPPPGALAKPTPSPRESAANTTAPTRPRASTEGSRPNLKTTTRTVPLAPPGPSAPSPTPPRSTPRSTPRQRVESGAVSTSSESESQESESEDERTISQTPRPGGILKRDVTITQRNRSKQSVASSRSEMGHGGSREYSPPRRHGRSDSGHGGNSRSRGVTPSHIREGGFDSGRPATRSESGHLQKSSFSSTRPEKPIPSSRSESTPVVARPTASGLTRSKIYARPGASLSTSALSHRGSAAAASRNHGSDTSEDEEDQINSDSEEDAPLAQLVPPKRPGTNLSQTSSYTSLNGSASRLPTSQSHGAPPRRPPRSAPLVDVNAPSNFNPSSKPVRSAAFSRSVENLRSTYTNDSPISPGASARSYAGPSPASQRSSMASSRSSNIPVPSPGQRTPATSTLVPRPFARRESPASSTGDSSSGKVPLTPKDGSDAGGPAGTTGRPTHSKRPSVSFEEPGSDSWRTVGRGAAPNKSEPLNDEARRRERRRSEARNAIELGNVIHGPPPVDIDDDNSGEGLFPNAPPNPWAAWAAQAQFAAQAQAQAQAMFANPQAFMIPPPMTNDPNYLAAHQQAMLIAKQTYQYTVAQQALAAAGEEWERSSNVSGFAPPGMGGGLYGMPHAPMFPPAPRSMFGGGSSFYGGGGSVYGGSVYGGGGGSVYGGGSQWGGSVYGESFGPPTARPQYQFPASSSQEPSGEPKPTGRQRTRTAPTSGPLPAQHAGRARGTGPPSSWKTSHAG